MYIYVYGLITFQLHVLPLVFQYGPNQYGLVVYGTIGHTSEPAVQYVKETRNAKQMLQFLDEVRLVTL